MQFHKRIEFRLIFTYGDGSKVNWRYDRCGLHQVLVLQMYTLTKVMMAAGSRALRNESLD